MKLTRFFVFAMEVKHTILIILLSVVCSVLLFLVGRWTKSAEIREVEVVTTDTLTVHDTIRVDRPVYITQRIVDTLIVPVVDTLLAHDTTYVYLPRTQREYSEETYRAWVSGYQPSLDSIVVYQKTQYITTTVREKARHWHVGVSAGYGAALNGKQVVLSPYFGVGLTYSLISF